MGRKRARVVASVGSCDGPQAWPLHTDQRLIGVYCSDAGAATLVACGPRHVQIRSTKEEIGKLLAFEHDSMVMGDHCAIQQQHDRTYAAYPTTSGQENESGVPHVRVFDAATMETTDVSVPWASHSVSFQTICNAFTDATGQRMVLVTREERAEGDATAWRLWFWRHEGEKRNWTLLRPGSMTGYSLHTWRASFFISPLFGPCVLVVCLARKDDATWALELQLLSAETEWSRVARRRHLISHSSQTNRDSAAAPTFWLAPSHMWALVTLDDPCKLCCVPTQLVGTSGPFEIPTNRIVIFDSRVVDVTWCDDLGTVLLSNGAVRFVAGPSLEEVEGALTLVDHDGVKDLSGLLPSTAQPIGPWNKLVWVGGRREIFAGCGSTVVSVRVEVDYREENDLPIVKNTDSSMPQSIRRRRRRLVHTEPGISSLLSKFSKPTPVPVDEVLSVARVALASVDEIDVALTLVAIVLQRVLQRMGLGNSPNDTRIQVGITEMLLTQLVTLESDVVHRIARQIVLAPTFRSRQERRVYYANAVESLVSKVHSPRDGILHSRHWVAFASTLGNHFSELLAHPSDRTSARQWLRVQGPFESKAAALLDSQGPRSAEWTLAAMVACYELVCQFYGLDTLEFDLSALTLAAQLAQPKAQLRLSFIARFASFRSSQLRLDADSSASCSSLFAIRLAERCGLMKELVQFCAALVVTEPFRLFHREPKLDQSLQRSLSSEIIVQCIADLSGLLQAAPLIPEASSWIHEEGYCDLDDLLRLLSDSRQQSHEAKAETASARAESALRERVLELTRRVLVELRLLVSMDAKALDSIFTDVFLMDTLWEEHQPSTDTTAPISIAQFVTTKVLYSENEALMRRRGCVVSRSVDQLGAATEKLPRHVRSCLRTLALGLWTQWVRLQCGKCRRDIQHAHEATEPLSAADQRRLGSSAVWCALHLKTLALFRAPRDGDDVSALQLQFLEAAAVLLPRAAASAVLWGFSLESISVRHSRRLRTLLQTLDGAFDNTENEKEIMKYRNELRHHVAAAGTIATEDRVDAFGLCCCDHDFQRIVWALLQRRFVVLKTPFEGNERVEMKKALRTKPSSVDGQISRQDVMRLLKAQREDIEKQMERLQQVATDNRTPPTPHIMEGNSGSQKEIEKVVETKPSPSRDIPKVRLTVRDLPPRERRTSPPQSEPIQNDTSAKNVLKLLQLRKEATTLRRDIRRHQSAPRMQAVPLPQVPTLEIDVSELPTESQGGPKAPVKVAKRHRERVLPLRMDENVTEMLLLASSGQWCTSVPLRTRSFDREPQRRSPVIEEKPPTMVTAGVQCTELQSRGAQTETRESAAPTIELEPSPLSTPPPPLHAPLAPEISPTPPVEAHDVGVQCRDESRPIGESTSHPVALPTRFPVYVDKTSEGSNRGTFLQISKLNRTTSSRETEKRPREIIVQRSARSSPRSSPVDDQSVSSVSVTHEDAPAHADEESYDQVQARRRQVYRSQFPPVMARTRQSGEGVESFLTLKTEMERMKRKLVELEGYARELDEDFKASHHTLEAIGRRRQLDDVDNVMKKTDRTPVTTGTLATKTTRDLEDARRLLAQLESLTTTD